jgi:hypothetical protein
MGIWYGTTWTVTHSNISVDESIAASLSPWAVGIAMGFFVALFVAFYLIGAAILREMHKG